MTHRRRLLACTAALLALHGGAARAADTKAPLRLVVPFAAGGTVDVVARNLTAQLSKELGQVIVIDNRGGAGGVIGADAVAKSPPDGNTLLLSNVSMVYAPALYKKLPFDVARDFTPITLVGTTPSVLVINPALPYANLQAFLAEARARPGELNYGSAGNGTSSHLAAELFRREAGVTVQHVPYRGGGPAVVAVLGGEMQFMIETLASVLPNIAGGKLKALAVTSDKRASALPSVPTMKEAGLTNYGYTTWFGLWGPPQMPAATVARIHAAFTKTLASPEVRAALERSGIEAATSTPAKFADLVGSDLKQWTALIQQAGVQAE